MRSSHSKLGLPVIIPGFKTNLVSQVPLGFQTQVSAEVTQVVLEIFPRMESSAELCARNEFKEEPSFSSKNKRFCLPAFRSIVCDLFIKSIHGSCSLVHEMKIMSNPRYMLNCRIDFNLFRTTSWLYPEKEPIAIISSPAKPVKPTKLSRFSLNCQGYSAVT